MSEVPTAVKALPLRQPGGRTSIRLLVCYDNAEGRLRAARALRRLGQKVGAWLDLRAGWSSLEFLTHPDGIRGLTDQLTRADILLISVSAALGLPLAVRAWLETALQPGGERRTALLALLERGRSSHSRCSATHWFLREVARRAGIDFLAAPGDDGLRTVEFRFVASAGRRVGVAGDFNQWNPERLRLRRRRGGLWSARTRLAPGRYEYRFVVDGHWLDDAQACGVVADNHASCSWVLHVT